MSPVAARLRALLSARGPSWSAPLEHFETLGSTSDRLKELARGGAPAWSVVLADAQTAGRGRHGHRWFSPPGNLYLSVLLRPPSSAPNLALIPLAAGLAVSDALSAFGVETRLKWPNDVLARERKIAGILTEGLSAAGGVEAVVLGVGLNLEAPPGAWPPDLASAVTCLHEEAGAAADKLEVAVEVLTRLGGWYHAVEGEPERVRRAWRERSLPWWGRPVEVFSGEQRVQGVARGIGPDGALCLETTGGTLVEVRTGEAREVRLVTGGAEGSTR